MLVVLVAMMLGSRDPLALALELKSLKTKPMLPFYEFYEEKKGTCYGTYAPSPIARLDAARKPFFDLRV